MDKERNVILEEMKRYEDEPASKVEEAYHGLLYPGTQLGLRTIGEVDSLKAVGKAELAAYHDAWYAPERMVVILAGQIEKASVITSQVKEWFGSLPARTTGEIETVTPAQKKPALKVTTKPDAAQAHIIIGLRTFARGSDDRFAWSLFNLIMGVSFTSRLFKEIREKRGLCYHIRSGASGYADVGSWDIYAGVATDKVGEAAAAIMEELKKARDTGITEAELGVAKKRLKTMLAFRAEDPEFWTEWYGRAEVYRMNLLTLEDYIKKIDTVSVEDINTLVRKYFRTESLNMSLVWNKKEDGNLLPLLTF